MLLLYVLAGLGLLAPLFGVALLLARVLFRADVNKRSVLEHEIAALQQSREQLKTISPVELALLPRTCSNCKNFDLAEGQAAIAQFPTFMRVASVISPAQINRRVEREFDRPCRFCDGKGKQLRAGDGELEPCRGCEGTGLVHEQQLTAPGAPEKARWDECGACMKKEVVVWGGDKQDCFEANT